MGKAQVMRIAWLRSAAADQVVPWLIVAASDSTFPCRFHVSRADGEIAFYFGDGLPELGQDRLIVRHTNIHQPITAAETVSIFSTTRRVPSNPIRCTARSECASTVEFSVRLRKRLGGSGYA